MFTGEYKHSIDSKNRLSIPSKFREELGDTFYVTKGLDNCLFIFSLKEWDKFQEKLTNLPLTNKTTRAFVRTFFAGATELTLDKQGRILIPSSLSQYASLNKDVYVNGAGSRLEIWDSLKWENYSLEYSKDMEQLASNMEELGIGF